MVSPKSHRPDNIDKQNSTASLFLGGVRRNWMEPVESRRGLGRDISALAHPSNLPTTHAQSDSATEPVLMSPITPGETLQPLSRGPAATVTAKPADPTRASTIPSPAPSTTSLPSPGINAVPERISPSIPTQPAGNHERMAPRPPNPAQQGAQNSMTGVSPGHQHRIATPHRPPSVQDGHPSDSEVPDALWKQWSAQLDAWIAEWESKNLMQVTESGEASIVKPRVELMRAALARKDIFYVTMHQVFCQCTIDTSTLGHIRAPIAGYNVLIQLLEDNNKMHYSIIYRLAMFPQAPRELTQQAWYQRSIKQVPLFMFQLAKEWNPFSINANHPPLVKDLQIRFACSSPILMLVLFTCVARRLHAEVYVELLQQLFWNDWVATKNEEMRMRTDPSQGIMARNDTLIREYLKLPRLPSRPSQTPVANRPVRASHTEVRPNLSISSAPGVSQAVISPSPAASQPMVSNLPQAQSPFAGQAPGSFPHVGEDSQGQRSEIVYPSQMIARPSVSMQGQNQGQNQGQRFNPPPPRDAQNRSMYNPQIQNPQMNMNMHMQARRLQQIPHGGYPMSNSPVQQVGNGFHPVPLGNPATSVNPPGHQQVAFASNQPSHSFNPHYFHQNSPTTPRTHHMTQQMGQMMSQYSPQNHQYAPTVHATSSPLTQTPVVAHTNPVSQDLPPPPQHPVPPHVSPPPPPPSLPHHTLIRHPSVPFLPQPGYRAPMTLNGDPRRLGLHLANLRDPMKKLMKLGPNGDPIDTELFSYFLGFVVPPSLIAANEPNYTWNFTLSKNDHQRLPLVIEGKDGRPPVWTYQPHCRTLRLRCVSMRGSPESIDEKTWATSPNFWPSIFYITVNGKELQVRRKAQNMKDLPLDISHYLKEGKNSLRLDLLLDRDECKKTKYFFGVEVMEIASFEDVLALVRPIPAAESRAAIQKRLTPTIDDDDLAVVTDNLTIGLVDPFTARVFDVPARSRNCDHHECFDRDTFIQTRKSVAGPTPMVEEWRCPVCKADARPQFLVVDQFLVEVHAELARTNRLEGAQAIHVKADGSWTLKVVDESSSEGQNDSTQKSLKRKADDMGTAPDKPRAKQESVPRHSQPRHQNHEIIELD